jgi:adenylate cyclase
MGGAMTGEPATPHTQPSPRRAPTWIERLRARGVLRIAASYGVIAWLLLQIADVVFDPLGVPRWVMIALLITLALGLPVAILLAWFYELTPSGVVADSASAAAPRPTVHGVRRYADVAIIVVLLTVVAVLLARQPQTNGDNGALEASLAVMPFTNIGGDPGNEYLSDGLAEELLDQIGRVPGLRVSARSSSFYFKDQNVDAITAAKKLAVAAVLEGSVRRQGDKLRVSVRLINGANGFQLWSSSFDRGSEDLLRTQQEIARSVVEALMPRFEASGAKLPGAATMSVSAHDLYLLGLYQQRLETDEGHEKAAELYEQAIAADPNFALAHAALGQYYFWNWFASGDADAREKAERLIRRSVALDPASSETHEALGTFLRYSRLPGAGAEFERAVALNPNNASALTSYATHLSLSGNPGKAIEILRQALAIDPALQSHYSELALAAAQMNRREESEAVVQRAFDFFGESASIHVLAAEVHNGFGGLPDEDVCVAHALKARQMDPKLEYAHMVTGVCLMRMGLLEQARMFAKTGERLGSFVFMSAVIDKADGREKALEYAQSVLLRRPRDLFLSIIIAHLLGVTGRPAEALEMYRSVNMPAVAMDEAIRWQSGAWGVADMAGAYIEVGNRQEGERLARWVLEYLQRLRANGGVDLEEEAAALAILGRNDEAIELLREEARTKGLWSNDASLRRLAYKGMRGDPRLKEIVAISDARWARIRARLPESLKALGLTMQDLETAAREAGQQAKP